MAGGIASQQREFCDNLTNLALIKNKNESKSADYTEFSLSAGPANSDACMHKIINQWMIPIMWETAHSFIPCFQFLAHFNSREKVEKKKRKRLYGREWKFDFVLYFNVLQCLWRTELNIFFKNVDMHLKAGIHGFMTWFTLQFTLISHFMSLCYNMNISVIYKNMKKYSFDILIQDLMFNSASV